MNSNWLLSRGVLRNISSVLLAYENTTQYFKLKYHIEGCKSGLDSGLNSQSKGCGFESCLILSKILDGNGLKAMPGSIPAPNSGSFVEK